MKFALLEIKMAIIKILQKFEIFACENTPDVLEFVEGVVRSPRQPVKVVFNERKVL